MATVVLVGKMLLVDAGDVRVMELRVEARPLFWLGKDVVNICNESASSPPIPAKSATPLN